MKALIIVAAALTIATTASADVLIRAETIRQALLGQWTREFVHTERTMFDLGEKEFDWPSYSEDFKNCSVVQGAYYMTMSVMMRDAFDGRNNVYGASDNTCPLVGVNPLPVSVSGQSIDERLDNVIEALGRDSSKKLMVTLKRRLSEALPVSEDLIDCTTITTMVFIHEMSDEVYSSYDLYKDIAPEAFHACKHIGIKG